MKYLLENINYIEANTAFPFHVSKQERIGKLKDPRAKKQSILGEFLLMKGLQEFYNLDYSKLDFVTNLAGKPAILENPIYYNISHSYDYCICAFSEHEIGVDIEQIRPLNRNVVSFFATSKEEQYISQDNVSFNKRGFEIFTLKESYFKMHGTGIKDLKSVEFTITAAEILCNDNTVQLTLNDELEGYMIAFCEKKAE
jgi:Phosphopantetheinyl transferase